MESGLQPAVDGRSRTVGPSPEHKTAVEASVSMLKVKVHDGTVRKRLNKDGLFGRAAGGSLFSLKRTWQHSLGL